MAHAFKCDCCGKYYDENKLKGKGYDENKRSVVKGICFVTSHRFDHFVDCLDLCDDCLTKVYELLGQNKREENSKNEEK